MRVLGLDPGLARVGYSVIETDQPLTLLDCGIIRTRPGPSDGERMVEIVGDLRQLIRLHRPALAAVEMFFFYRSSKTIAVVQARGAMLMTLARFGVPVREVQPMQVKRCLTGNGHADKPEVLDAVMRELQLRDPPRPDDAADAVAIALTAWFQR
ncbi:MAG: crossover junction endodeoxyribonuclease RuvC [Aphanocapsa feldmannii 277cV]|uniref:Crossover junction endodeoxyribonuclease RuvC n=2 Tax=Aphanocapsa feldmannii TaxID=192050 RepID=A0A524RKS0_9CHRO|nr:MAG: crossover junction endodeoxyribonuclease RuvC [Aphanocapsa feldmannii 288cV]TGG90453.1 MAG: crossover junction endodeoxyribonuclease RuvC [Aphanocapsa feldmannii 277cV]TGH18157.1 MAG: crossover junction endodeoxyribonuclease RuvC [Aphanocapsa feldmannii 277cI]